MADDKNLNTVQQYAGDMASLESHIEAAIDRQIDEVTTAAYPEAVAAIKRFHTMVKSHREGMKAHLDSIGGSESHPIKGAISTVAGMAAGVVNLVRTEHLSKSLRDDYTAFNLAAMGYGMLHATAHCLGHAATADLAERYLRDYAKAAQEINQIMPGLVAWELRQDGHQVEDQQVQHSVQTINRAWQETTPSAAHLRRAA